MSTAKVCRTTSEKEKKKRVKEKEKK